MEKRKQRPARGELGLGAARGEPGPGRGELGPGGGAAGPGLGSVCGGGARRGARAWSAGAWAAAYRWRPPPAGT